jgi:hypothetical protein
VVDTLHARHGQVSFFRMHETVNVVSAKGDRN